MNSFGSSTWRTAVLRVDIVKASKSLQLDSKGTPPLIMNLKMARLNRSLCYCLYLNMLEIHLYASYHASMVKSALPVATLHSSCQLFD